MFGTLTIQLPSSYEGGHLTVCHQGKETEFSFSTEASNNFYFAAFYADCEHEVKPVTKGYRLCLIYNLLYSGTNQCPVPQNNQKQVTEVVSALEAWNEDIEDEDCPTMMAFMMEHQYCEAGLSFQSLKNTDRAVAEILMTAKNSVDFDLYVGNVLLQEVWAASHDGYGDYTAEELCNEYYNAVHLKAYRAKKVSSSIELDKECLVPEDFFDNVNPDKEHFQEATGNEGATVDKHYHWAALLLWPVKKRTAVKGGSNMVKLFVADVEKNKDAADIPVVAKDIMREMRAGWRSIGSYMQFLQALLTVGSAELIAECLDILYRLANDYPYFLYNNSLCEVISTIGTTYGWDLLKLPLKAACMSSTVDRFCQFLSKISIKLLSADHKEFCQFLAAAAVNFMVSEQDVPPSVRELDTNSRIFTNSYHSPVVLNNRNKMVVCQLVTILNSLGCGDLLSSVVSAFCSKPGLYPVVETLGPAIVDISQRFKLDSGPLRSLLDYCVSSLEASTVKVLTPSEHTCAVKFTCTCEDCEVLKEFMQNPNEKWKRFTVVKKRRQHVLQKVDKDDLTYVVEAITKPQSLVLIKIKDTYDEAVKRQQKELSVLAALRLLLPSGEPPTKKQCVGIDAASVANRQKKKTVHHQ